MTTICFWQGWYRLGVMLGLILLIVFSAIQVRAATGQSRLSKPSVDEEKLAAAVNRLRNEADLDPLQINDLLSNAAQTQANDMVAHGFFDHIGSDGSTAIERIAQAGYVSDQIGEIIADVYNIEAAIDLWQKNEADRSQLFSNIYREFGLGIAYKHKEGWNIYVITLGVPKRTNTANTPPPPKPTITVTPTPKQTATPTVVKKVAVVTSQTSAATSKPTSPQPPKQADKPVLLPTATVLPTPTVTPVAGAVVDSVDSVVDNNASVEASVTITLSQPPSVATALSVTQSTAAPSGNPCPSPATAYTIAEGDTLAAIASQFGFTWQELAEANKMEKPGDLRIGQVVCIPSR